MFPVLSWIVRIESSIVAAVTDYDGKDARRLQTVACLWLFKLSQ
jgi:hypothetical protein